MEDEIKYILKSLYHKIFHEESLLHRRWILEYICRDMLSPGLREHLIHVGCMKFHEVYSKTRDFTRSFKEAVKVIELEWNRIVNKTAALANLFKPYYLPPALLVKRGSEIVKTSYFLEPEVGCWIKEDWGYLFITYWFKFPYDIHPGDGVEYEPWTIVIKEGRVIEYQARSHWEIVHIDPDIVTHIGSRPIISFADHAHTPVPILKRDAIEELTGVSFDRFIVEYLKYVPKIIGFYDRRTPIVLERRVCLEIGDLLPLTTYIISLHEALRKYYVERVEPKGAYEVLVHVGPSRRTPPPHNPLLKPWYRKPLKG